MKKASQLLKFTSAFTCLAFSSRRGSNPGGPTNPLPIEFPTTDVDPVGQAHRYKRIAHGIGLLLTDLLCAERWVLDLAFPGVKVAGCHLD